MKTKKRLFFGFEVQAPWPEEFPKGRIVDEKSRHITVAFLGDIFWEDLQPHLVHTPALPFPVGPVGEMDQALFLPERRPRVVSYHANWSKPLEPYAETLLDWLESVGFQLPRRPLLSHVTLARSPFKIAEWRSAFQPLPAMISGLHLYESVGHLTYQPLWSADLLPAFDEIEHTADIAFTIRGTSMAELQKHASTALSFHFPPLLGYIEEESPHTLEEVMFALNDLVSRADVEEGCPFKAVSLCGEVKQQELLEWEMIVDV